MTQQTMTTQAGVVSPPAMTNVQLCATTLTVSIHRKTINPIYGEGAIHVTLEDEAAGTFILLESIGDEAGLGKIRIDLEELDAVTKVAKSMMTEITKNAPQP